MAEQGYVDSLISELDDNNAKYNREEMRFIARDEFDINEKAVVFNRKKAVSIKEKIQSDIKKLISLITEINDGSFEIQDMASDDISNW